MGKKEYRFWKRRERKEVKAVSSMSGGALLFHIFKVDEYLYIVLPVAC